MQWTLIDTRTNTDSETLCKEMTEVSHITRACTRTLKHTGARAGTHTQVPAVDPAVEPTTELFEGADARRRLFNSRKKSAGSTTELTQCPSLIMRAPFALPTRELPFMSSSSDSSMTCAHEFGNEK